MHKVAAVFRAWTPTIVMMGVIFAFSSIPAKEMPTFGLLDLLVKKGGHAGGYALLALANLRALRFERANGAPRRSNPRAYLAALLVTVFYALTDEFHQSFVPGRHPALADVGIDTLGALLGLSLAAWYDNRS